MDSTQPIGSCNICGGEIFGLGPCNRLSYTQRLPACKTCGSLERHRIIRKVFSLIPNDMVHGCNALQFSGDESLDHSQFASFTVSEYGKQNSLDIQNIDLGDGRFDWVISNHVVNFVPDDIAALREMARVAGEQGIVLLTVGGPTHRYGTTRYNTPTGPHQAFYIYGADFGDRLMEAVPDCSVLEIVSTDPVSAAQDTIYFYSKNWAALRRIAAAAAPKNIYARLTPAKKFRQSDPAAPAWAELEQELTHWRRAERTPRIWIRDDDARDAISNLTSLWKVCHENDVPLCVAAIPARCDEGLALWAADKSNITVVPHGFDHSNRVPQDLVPELGKSEFPEGYPEALALKQLRAGQLILKKLFNTKYAPVFVPPWGRCFEGITKNLFSMGFRGVSVMGRRGTPSHQSLGIANVHVCLPVCAGDSWGVDEHDLILRLVQALRDIRTCPDDPQEALGINTHHRGMVDRDFVLLGQLIAFTKSHGAKWIDVGEAAGLLAQPEA